jgi:hypothetical protein
MLEQKHKTDTVPNKSFKGVREMLGYQGLKPINR